MRFFGGLRDAMTLASQQEADTVQAGYTGGIADPSTYPLATPWSSHTLQRMVFADVFGETVPENSRAAAMRIPAIARGRNLLVSSIAQLPLAALRLDQRIASPSWMTSWGGGLSPQHRMAWTVDDLIFYGWSCWTRTNNADGFPGAYARVAPGDWSITPDNVVEVNGIPMGDDEVTLIPGFHEGILSFGVDAISDARTLYQVVRDRINAPVPPIDLHQTDGPPLSNDEIDELVDRWIAARRSGKAVGYTSKFIEARALQGDDANLMIEARNAAALDLARLIGVTANMVDATSPKASLNYETATGRNQEFSERDLLLYMTPIVARLSGDDVMPHGQRVVFDTSALTGPTLPATGPTHED